ncbi:Ig-like domain-containing protein [Chitinophaga horti]|uniref:Ig-like domain-containing protein n=1 Tax=Chitinophaga horti TaxID=2920382 RepID=A0ABY6IZW4_9BACT|nr:Ig-like domain-containing protein [Chitinophaga horti]UYQ92959.1 Ig-like domain-containing protein [Chitinophaga horti]
MNQIFRATALVLIVVISCYFTQCANIVPPGGGPKDSLPPRLLGVNPPDSSLHFSSKRISFTFDEYIELDNVIEKLIVSPTLKRTPTITAKLRTITINIKDTLKPNTTYTFNFNDAVRDLNERNPIEDFQYVVSTGDYLDSLQITGTTFVAETGQVDSSVGVFLYSGMEDSIVSKEKPLYYARSRGDGSFRFKNLAPGRYKVFALKEEDRDLQYTQHSEYIAFVDSAVYLSANISGINLPLFREKDTVVIPQSEEKEEEEEEEKKDEEKKKKPKFLASAQLQGGQQELGDPMHVGFTIPIRQLDSTKILLLEDTTLRRVNFTAKMDDTTRQTLILNYEWKEGTPYQLILPAGFATDTLEQSFAKSDTIRFTSKELSDYGTVMVTLKITDSTILKMKDSVDLVVQLVLNKEVKYSANINNGTWKRGLIQPGQYDIRILVDENKNGVWDTGIYYGNPKKQPEKVFSVPKPTNIKANWVVPNDITL